MVFPAARPHPFSHEKEIRIERDIKPSNIIFINGEPRLADVGLVAEIHPGEEASRVGTVGYMPPETEPPGTVQADIFALGKVLYVISTGNPLSCFPVFSDTLGDATGGIHFMRLNSIILKACEPDCAQRYTTAAEMRDALLNVRRIFEAATTKRI